MASTAAQSMFNSLTAQEQQQVQASIAGNPNGLEDWYQAAARAGDPRAIRAGGTGQSEDFARFNEGTLTGWAKQYYDEAASRAAGRPQFRSMRGEQGYFDKPTECPPGMGPSGPNETDPCTTKGYSEAAAGGDTSTPATGSATGAEGPSQSQLQMSMMYSPLRDLLANQGHFLRQFDAKPGDGNAAIQGGIMGGGGMWWSPTQQPERTTPVAAQPAGRGNPGSGPVDPGGYLRPMQYDSRTAPTAAQPVGRANPGAVNPGGYLLRARRLLGPPARLRRSWRRFRRRLCRNLRSQIRFCRFRGRRGVKTRLRGCSGRSNLAVGFDR